MRTASSILLLIILVPVTVVLFVVWSLKTNLLTAQFLKHELAARNVYGIVEDQLSKQIATLKLENLPIATTDIQTLAQRVIPATWLQQSVETILDRSFGWFNGPLGTTLSVPIDLRGPKAAITPALDTLIASAIPRLPECPKKGVASELCRTPDVTVATVKDMLKTSGIDLTSVIAQLPDSLDLANPVLPSIKLGQDSKTTQQEKAEDVAAQRNPQKQQEEAAAGAPKQEETLQQKARRHVVGQLTSAKEKYHQGLQYWADALIGYAVLLLLYFLVNMKGWKRITRWTGILFLTIGILPLAVSIATKQLMERLLLPGLHLEKLPFEAQTAIPAAIRDAQSAIFFSILVISATTVVVGIGTLVAAHWIPIKTATLVEKVEGKVMQRKRVKKSY